MSERLSAREHIAFADDYSYGGQDEDGLLLLQSELWGIRHALVAIAKLLEERP